MKNEIKSLTGLRGIAAFYVMIYHYMRSYFSNINEKVNSSLSEVVYNIVSQGYLAVDLFFMLSSFVLCLRYLDTFKNGVELSDYKIFMRKRFERIYLVYFLSIVFVFISFKDSSILNFITEALFLQQFTNVIFENHNVSTWSLGIEWMIYLLFPILIFFFQKLNKKATVIASIIALLCLFFIQFLPKYYFDLKTLKFNYKEAYGNLNVHFGLPALIRGIIAYFFGYVIFNYRPFNNTFGLIASLALIAVELIFNISDILMIVGFVMLFSSLLKENFLTKILVLKPIYYLGQISYSLYLFHYIVLNLMREYSEFIPIKMNTINFYLVAILSSIIIAIISYELIEKKLSKIIFKKKKPLIKVA